MPKQPAAPVRRRPGRVRMGMAAVVAVCGLAAPAAIALASAAPAAERPTVESVSSGSRSPSPRLSSSTARPGSSPTELMGPVVALIAGGMQRTMAATVSIAAAAVPPPPEYYCPVPGSEFVNSWGAPRSGGRKHKGVDMMAPTGTAILAPMAGEIRHSRSALGGLGFYLTDDQGNEIYGAHLQRLGPEGPVEAGAHLGTVGTTGNASTPHLHLSMKLEGTRTVNPYPIVAEWCPVEAGAPRR